MLYRLLVVVTPPDAPDSEIRHNKVLYVKSVVNSTADVLSFNRSMSVCDHYRWCRAFVRSVPPTYPSLQTDVAGERRCDDLDKLAQDRTLIDLVPQANLGKSLQGMILFLKSLEKSCSISAEDCDICSRFKRSYESIHDLIATVPPRSSTSPVLGIGG